MFKIGVCLTLLSSGAAAEKERRNELVLHAEAEVGEVVITQRPHEYLKAAELPASLDYRTEGLLTSDLNQHIPVYCGSCWAHAAFSSIADRLKIKSGGKQRDIIPSVQALINCGNGNLGMPWFASAQ